MAEGMGAAEAGNYKGVMLCNRPTDPSSYAPGAQMLNPSVDAPSFRPVGLPAEPLGLNPAKENLVSNVLAVHDEASRRRAARGTPHNTNFLNKHKAWLHEMGKKKAELNMELQASAMAAEQKRAKFVAYTASLRSAVRQRAAELDYLGVEHAEPLLQKSMPPAPAPASPEYYEPPPPPPPMPKARAVPLSSKPAWAMTEGEADDMEDAEALALVDFAKDLDYDSYIDDLEVRQALQVIRERIDTQKALEAVAADVDESDEKIAAAGGDWRAQFLSEWNGDDTRSTTTVSKRAPIPVDAHEGGNTKPDWDSSTNAGDERRGITTAGSRAMAEELLAMNPEMKSKHSVRSLANMVDKAGTKMSALAEEELPPLRVVTIVENPRVTHKEVDASNLPYLHRNPAI